MHAETRRRDLERYIAESRDVRRKVVWTGALGVAIATAFGLGGAGSTAVFAIALIALVIASAGAWITTAHIQDFEKELRGPFNARTRPTRRR